MAEQVDPTVPYNRHGIFGHNSFYIPGFQMTMKSSLFNTARRSLTSHIDNLEDLGDVPFDVAESVINRIDSAAKLRALELSSPQICGHTSEIWLRFIKRDIPYWQKRLKTPEDPKDWSKVYFLLKEEENERIKEAQKRINEAVVERETQLFRQSTKLVKMVPTRRPGQKSTFKPFNGKQGAVASGSRKMYPEPPSIKPEPKEKPKIVVRHIRARPNALLSLVSGRVEKPSASRVIETVKKVAVANPGIQHPAPVQAAITKPGHPNSASLAANASRAMPARLAQCLAPRPQRLQPARRSPPQPLVQRSATIRNTSNQAPPRPPAPIRQPELERGPGGRQQASTTRRSTPETLTRPSASNGASSSKSTKTASNVSPSSGKATASSSSQDSTKSPSRAVPLLPLLVRHRKLVVKRAPLKKIHQAN